MKVKTLDLTGLQLDYAVAMVEGYTHTTDGISHLLEKGKDLRILGHANSGLSYSPSTGPAGDDIIDKHGISTERTTDEWQASVYDRRTESMHSTALGPTRRIAAMRCFVSMEWGEEVGLPEGLK